MIVNLIIDIIVDLMDFLYNLLPDWTIVPANMGNLHGVSEVGWDHTVVSGHSALETILIYAAKYNDFVPIDQATLVIGLGASFYGAFLVYRAVRFALGIIRGAGTA